MGICNVLDHPLLRHKITMLRSVDTGNKEFRELVEEIATLICYEATRDVATVDMPVTTPLCETTGQMIETKFAFVPIMRAGIGMLNGLLHLMPTAKVGHIGLYREPETLRAVEYYCKLPADIADRDVFLIDPMLATGNTACEAIKFLRARSVRRLKLLCLIASPEGIKKVQGDHPDVDIYTAARDARLNSHGYIMPGLGDAGDRLFGTK
jgi:uracil phosphoribosyltransferase